ncbi:hypothetical protein Tco_0744049, partial [Tanacetum coccineum]
GTCQQFCKPSGHGLGPYLPPNRDPRRETPRTHGFALRGKSRFSLSLARLKPSRRGVVLDSILCPLCDADVEDVHHVMFRCDMALFVLRKICWWWELDWQVLSSFSDWNG